MATSRLASASWIAFRLEGRTLLVEVKGIVELDAMRQVRGAIGAAICGARVDKILVDFRQCVLAVSAHEWQTVCLEAAAHRALDMRVGILGCEVQYEELWQHCQSMVQRGFTRVVFKDAGRARDWAGLPATVLRASDFVLASPLPPAERDSPRR